MTKSSIARFTHRLQLIEPLESRILLSAASRFRGDSILNPMTPGASDVTVQPDVLTGGPIVLGGTAEDTTNGLKVRSTPGGSDVVGTVDADVRGSVIGGPVTADLNGVSYTWWEVQWPNLVGWSVVNFLENVYSTLYPENLSLSSTGGPAGAGVNVDFDIKNIGTGASLATTANIVLSSSSTAPGPDDPVLGSIDIPALAYNSGAQPFSPTITIPSGTADGQYYIWIVVDPNNSANQGPNAGHYISSPYIVGFATLTGNGMLSIAGTSGADSILVTDSDATVTVVMNGTSSVPFDASDITSGITITGGAGNDTISLATVPLPASVGGAGGDDSITGGADNDSLRGGGENDTIGGAGGDDTVVGGGADDCVKGGAGDDLIAGGPGNNTIHGGAGNDSIVSGAGDNLVNGNLGNDTIVAGAGSSQLFAGPGDDSITGSTTAGDQPDSIYCGGSTDTIIAGSSDSIFDSVPGDQITGGIIVS